MRCFRVPPAGDAERSAENKTHEEECGQETEVNSIRKRLGSGCFVLVLLLYLRVPLCLLTEPGFGVGRAQSSCPLNQFCLRAQRSE